MKTMKNLAALILAILFANAVVASGNLKVNMLANDAEFAVMEISNSSSSIFEIEVTNDYGQELYALDTKTPVNEFKKRYDFSNLEDGTYFYTVKIDDEKVVKEMEVENGVVEIVEVRKSVEPYFVQKGEMLKFSFLNFQEENIKIYVYNETELLAESKLGSEFTISKALDLKDLDDGDYEVVLTNEKDVFTHKFTIE